MKRWIQLSGLYRREVARFFKVPLQTIGAPIINATLYLLIFGISLGESIKMEGELSYLAFLIPGLTAMSLIRNSFDNASSAIIGQKYLNELQDLRVTPFSILQISMAKGISSLTRGLLVAFITIIVGEIFYFIEYRELLSIANPFTLTYFLLCGGLAFGFLGIAVAMYSRSFEHVGAVSLLILLPLVYLGGVFFGLEGMHPVWQKASHLNPLFYLISGIRYGMVGTKGLSLSLSMSMTFLFFLFCSALALMSLRDGSRYFKS